jgi:hypothetical protein
MVCYYVRTFGVIPDIVRFALLVVIWSKVLCVNPLAVKRTPMNDPILINA